MRDGFAMARRAVIRIRAGLGTMGFLIALFFLAGFAEKNKIPSGIIPRDKMQKILWDMIQADQYADLYLAKDTAGSNAKLETLKLYQQVFELNQVSHEDFEKSFKFYIARPDLSRSLIDSISLQANKDRATVAVANTPAAPKNNNAAVPFHPFARPGGQLLPPGRLPATPPTSTHPPAAHPASTRLPSAHPPSTRPPSSHNPADSAARRANRPFHRHKPRFKVS
jgi:hypothetical protein